MLGLLSLMHKKDPGRLKPGFSGTPCQSSRAPKGGEKGAAADDFQSLSDSPTPAP
jgi:hypothetical protein